MTRYWKVECSNGVSGCDDNFVTVTEDAEFTETDLLDYYAYESGYAGMENDDWEENGDFDNTDDNYHSAILENSCYDEITEDEYNYLIEEEGWEGR